MAVSFHYPIALDLVGKRCVVVGGGTVGARKAQALLDAGASVLLVAPAVNRELMEMISSHSVMYLAEPFVPEHLENAFLVVAATNLPEVNTRIAQAARERKVLLNMAAPGTAEEDTGDFATMATVRRGDLLLAVTTGGAGPALSARLKRQLETEFGAEWVAYTALLRELRNRAQEMIPGDSERAVALRNLVQQDSIRQKVAAGDIAGAREEGLQCLWQ